MSNTHHNTIAIIGGGFCGIITAAQLCRQATQAVKIVLINKGYPFGKGVAYSAHTYTYLLNVRAVNMSAYPDEQQHFLDWICNHPKFNTVAKHLLADVYLPRKVYGEYLEYVWQQAMDKKPSFVEVEIVDNFATGAISVDSGYSIQLEDGATITANDIVLATGNLQPKNVLANTAGLVEGQHYFANPWQEACVTGVDNKKDILIIGNGLTMVDTVLGLMENKFKGRIYTVSPGGFQIRSHKASHPGYSALKEDINLDEPFTLHELFAVVHKHAKKLFELGLAAQPVMEALRADTPRIWQKLTLSEKKAFIKRLSHQWNTVRHRLPMHIHELMQNLRIRKRLDVVKGRIKDVNVTGNDINITLYNKETKTEQSIVVGRIINCTGPGSDLRTCPNALLRSLAAEGVITADELNMGLNANPVTGAVINTQGVTSENMYTLGGNLKGLLWESTAVPELRKQAQALAALLVGKMEKVNENYIAATV